MAWPAWEAMQRSLFAKQDSLQMLAALQAHPSKPRGAAEAAPTAAVRHGVHTSTRTSISTGCGDQGQLVGWLCPHFCKRTSQLLLLSLMLVKMREDFHNTKHL